MSPTLAAGSADGGLGIAARYQRHRPEQTLLCRIIEQYYPPFFELMAHQGSPLPDYVQREFKDYLGCGRYGTRLSSGTLRHLPRRASAGVQLKTAWKCGAPLRSHLASALGLHLQVALGIDLGGSC